MSDQSADYLDGMRDGMTYRAEHIENLKAEIERLRTERDGLRKLLDDETYIRCKADYQRGHLSHCNYLAATERKALGTALAGQEGGDDFFL
jgi:hypothetical protein